MLAAFPDSSSFSLDEVLKYFFQQFDSVWFVMVFGIKELDGRPIVLGKLHLNPKKRGTDFSQLKDVLERMYKALPEPQWSAQNARYRVKAKDLTGRYHGVLQHGGNVKMSAREM